jgi:predicted MPP superfamily phosphohydrolase
MADPDMSAEKLNRLVNQFNALKPDLVLIAGDLKSGKKFSNRHYSPAEIAAQLARLKARLGVVAVLGNHDYWHDPDAQTAELRKRAVLVLVNDAIRRGPLVIGGIADEITDHDDAPATFAAMDKLGAGPRILLTHGPDIVPELPGPVAAIFTGHTHCGQIVMPFFGALSYSSRFGDRFACGQILDSGQTLLVGAGLGTSIIPLRYGAPPSLWLVTLGPKRAKEADIE